MSPVKSAHYPPLSPISSVGGADNTSAGDALLSPSDGPLFAVLGCFLSFIAGDAFLSAFSDWLLSLIAGDSFLSAISGHLLSHVADGSLLAAVSDCFLSFVANISLLSAVFGCFLSSVAGSGLLFAVFDGGPLSLMLVASFWALFLLDTPSYACCSSLSSLLPFNSFLPSLPTPFARNLTPFTEKKLFDQGFITKRPVVSTQQFEKLDLSFGQYSYSAFVKINKLWQSKFYNLKLVCLLEAIVLMNLIFWDDSFILFPRYIVLLAKKLRLITQHVNNGAIKERIVAFWQNRTITRLNTLFVANPD